MLTFSAPWRVAYDLHDVGPSLAGLRYSLLVHALSCQPLAVARAPRHMRRDVDRYSFITGNRILSLLPGFPARKSHTQLC
jgi:hypothetical protein